MGLLIQASIMAETDFPITLYHNPDCGTSRNVLAIVQAAGYAPTVVEYRKAGWTRPQLETLLGRLGVSARALMRDKGTPAEALGLLEPGVSEDDILEAMIQHPILVERPVVITPRGARICRPHGRVLDLLERAPERFTRADGQVIELT